MRKIYTSVDLGSDSIKVLVGEVYNNRLCVLATSTVKSKGIKKGLIVDANEALATIRDAISEVEGKLSISINKVIANVPSYYANFDIVNAEILKSDDDLRINGSDIFKVLQVAVKSKMKKDREFVTIIPINFTVDDKKNIKDPKNLIGRKLGVKGMLVTTPLKNVQSIVSIFQSLNIDVIDMSFGSIADYEEFKNNATDKGISAVINIGYDITTVSLFNKGIIINSEIIQIGSRNIDNDISYVFKTDKKTSQKLKENFAVAHKKFARVNEVKEVITSNKDIVNITQYDISQVVMSRLTEILKLAKKQTYLLTNREISYIIITGGVSELPGMSHLVDEIFGNIAKIGNIDTIGIRNNKYSTVSGLIKCFNSKLELRDKEYSMVELDDSDDTNRKRKLEDSGVLNKVFGYFFDN
ncbi:cell division protein ftsA [Clostridium sp. CAG:1193]|nr:cell division protein ftsA [Clostridium sp. CAG:1193]